MTYAESNFRAWKAVRISSLSLYLSLASRFSPLAYGVSTEASTLSPKEGPMKFALSFLLTGLLVLGACSDRDPVSSNSPGEPSGKRISSSLTLSAPVAGLAESRNRSARLRAWTPRRGRDRRRRGHTGPFGARARRRAVGCRVVAVQHRVGCPGLRRASTVARSSSGNR